jgi:hypothetical protein
MRRFSAPWLVATLSGACAVLIGCGGHRSAQRSTRTGRDSTVARERAALARSVAETRRLEREVRRARRTSTAAGEGGGALFSEGARRDFARLSAASGGQLGLAVSGLGRGVAIDRLGRLQGGVAWSTIKVPLAVAAVKQGGAAGRSDLLDRAITASDNAAAEQLWSALGPPQVAGRKVQAVLAAAGDAATQVQTARVRAGFTSFGQTSWPLAAQQTFVAALPCLEGSDGILALMGRVVASQRWGLGSVGVPARFKGGWGPDPAGGYLVRQMGLLDLPGGRSVAVSLAAIPSDGRFATGASVLTRLARWVVAHVGSAAVPAARC